MWNSTSHDAQVVREHYLRDDISSGSPLDLECDAESAKLSAEAKQYLVVDTNVALQQVGKSESDCTCKLASNTSGPLCNMHCRGRVRAGGGMDASAPPSMCNVKAVMLRECTEKAAGHSGAGLRWISPVSGAGGGSAPQQFGTVVKLHERHKSNSVSGTDGPAGKPSDRRCDSAVGGAGGGEAPERQRLSAPAQAMRRHGTPLLRLRQ